MDSSNTRSTVLSSTITLPRTRLFDLRYRGMHISALNGDYASFSLPLHLQQNDLSSASSSPASSQQQTKDQDEATEEDSQSPLAKWMGSRAFTFGASPNSQRSRDALSMGRPSASSPPHNSTGRPSSPPSPNKNSRQQQQQPDEYINKLAKNLHVSHLLRGHSGCVNSIEFNSAATMLVTASDDTNLNLYSTIDNKWSAIAPGGIPTAHTRNIFNAVFLPGTNDRHIVSCGLDGNVVLTVVDDGSGNNNSRATSVIHESDYMLSNIEINPSDPNVLYVTRGSGGVAVVDVRSKRKIGEFSVSSSINARPCNGLGCHPHYPFVLAVGSDSPIVYLCDTRMLPGYSSSSSSPAVSDGNSAFLSICNRQAAGSADGVGGLNFSDRGDKIVVSYKGGEVVSYDWTVSLPASNRRKISPETSDGLGLSFEFNTCKYQPVTEVPAKVYVGRQNNVTMFKEAVFFADDRMIASGGDCGHVFFWDASTCRLLTKVRADSDVVNGVLSHPSLPVVVACGIDSHARVISACEKVNEKIWPSSRNPAQHQDENQQQHQQHEGGSQEQELEQPGVNPRSLFRLRAQMMRHLLGLAGGRFASLRGDSDEENDEDQDDDEDEGQGGGDAEYDIWAAEDDDSDREDDFLRRRGQEEYSAQQNEQLRELILSTVIVLRQQVRARGTLGQLTDFFRARARSLRLLIQDAARVLDDSYDDEEDDEDDGEHEEHEEQEESGEENGEDEEALSDVGQNRHSERESSSQNDNERCSAVEPTTTTTRAIPETQISQEGENQNKTDVKMKHSVQELAEDERAALGLEQGEDKDDVDDQGKDDEVEDDEGDDVQGEADSSEDDNGNAHNDDDDDEDDEDNDDALMQQLLDAVQPTLELAKSTISRCQRSGVLSDDSASPTVFRPRSATAASQPPPTAALATTNPTTASSGGSSSSPPTHHPLVELAAAIADVAYLALTEKDHLANLSAGMRQAYQVPYLRVLSMRAMLLAATGNFDEAIEHSTEILSIDDTRTDAIGIAVGIARARLQMRQPEPESFLQQLLQYCRAIARSRMSPLTARRQAARLERSLNTLIEGGREQQMGESVFRDVST